MKKEGHPILKVVTATCVCGSSLKVYTTSDKLATGICSACHPFYTGQQKYVDTAGMIEKFRAKFGDKANYGKR
jgi:large subunit ribosomal protein L31